ncbi:LuxR C-terminal-related transcriptional regulator [Streptomyces sp. NPDC047108]|uniref:LuxR C-terminal-related transcriptional regulator n=1 Tax=Streptomyces sp. NPDC047108 TaxID=3155025 RepID=UPI0033D65264
MGERRGPRSTGVRIPSEKITVPGTTPTLITRERLHAALDAAAAQPVTLVCAPAGYGKTMLLSAWVSTTGSPVAWVRVDSDDNDPRHLWHAVRSALLATGAVPEQALAALAVPPGDIAAPAAQARVVLVLDGLEALNDPLALHGLELLIRHQPAWLRLVLASRRDPPLQLYRLRLACLLHEIREEELRFTEGEAAELLRGYGLEPAPRDLTRIMQLTEGWPAGLRLAAVSMRLAPDPSAFVAGFSGDERSVADYLAGEILSRSPPAEREFLLLTSVCERLSPDLARVLTGRDDAAAALDRLYRGNVLIGRTGPGGAWHRCHPLLRGHLYAELRRRHPRTVPGLHRTAADWYEAHDLPVDAVRQALAASDLARASTLMERHGTGLVMSGRGGTVRRLLGELPEAAMAAEPGLLLAAALADLDAGDVVSGSRHLALHARTDPHPTDPQVRALRQIARLKRARMDGSLSEALHIAERIPLAVLEGDDLSALAMADRGMVHVELGHLGQGKADLESALTIAVRRGLDHLTAQCMSCLAAVAAAECSFARAAHLGEEAAAFALARGWERTALCAPAYEAAAWAELQQADSALAERYSRLARQSVRGQADPSMEFGARMVGAVTAYERGERHQGLLDLRRAWAGCADRPLMPELVAFGAVAEVEMALASGRHPWAVEALERARVRLDDSAETTVLEAAVLAARGQGEAARSALRAALDGSAEPVVVSTLIEAWLLEARLCATYGEEPRAAHALREAVALAGPRQALRPFRVSAPGLRKLLVRSLPGAGPLEPFAAEVLRIMPTGGETTAAVSLTPRETALLQQLPSLHTLEEIAADLFVSVNTLKTHLRSIYRKLQVGSRRDAVAAAREQGLL